MSKQQEIITIAREVIHSKGYQATSISDILVAAKIGKGQFYHYFSSKHYLGLAVVEDLIQEWDQKLILGILKSSEDPVSKLNNMLDWTVSYHSEMDSKIGCPFGNLAIEMSEHDEYFRLKIHHFFERWIDGVQNVLDEMVEKNLLNGPIDTEKHAQAIIAMLEGGILLMKIQQDMKWFFNVIEVIRQQYTLSK